VVNENIGEIKNKKSHRHIATFVIVYNPGEKMEECIEKV
jgi:hypothetical protein